MTGTLAVTLLVVGVVVAIIAVVMAYQGAAGRVLTPIALFVLIDLAATLPAMLPTDDSVLLNRDGTIAMLVAVGLLVAMASYVAVGGLKADQLRWRTADVAPETLRDFGRGLAGLVGVLVALSFVRFGGVPPMLRGGFRSLLDPVGNAEQVTMIREGRRSLTKGAVLLGDSYQGQGLMNAFSEAGWMVAVAGAVVYWSWRRTRRSLAGVLLVVALLMIFQGSTGQRAPLVFALLCGAAALTLRVRLRNEAMIATGMAIIAFLLLIMPLSKGDKAGVDLASRVEAAWTRVTDGNGRNSAHIVNLVDTGQLAPAHGRLLLERSKAVLPGVSSQDPFAYRLGGMVNGTGRNRTGYLTPTQFGLLYAEGGPATVLIGYGLTGAMIGLLWRLITRLRGPAGATIAAVSAVVLGKFAITGAPGMAAMGSVVMVALALVMTPAALGSLTARRAGAPRPGEPVLEQDLS